MRPRLSVIIPVYNEAERIGGNLLRLLAYLETAFPRDFEVVVVDDGSSDDTERVVSRLAEMHRLTAVRHAHNRGLSAALRTGILRSSGWHIVTMDADLTYAPEIAGELVEALEKQSADIVCASPYAPGGRCVNVPFTRLLLSKCANRFLSMAVHGRIATLTAMVRAYNGDFARIAAQGAAPDEWTFGVLLWAYRKHARIVEVPAVLDWSGQPAARAARMGRKRILSHTYRVIVEGVRTRPALAAAAPGLVPGLLPLVVALAVLMHASLQTIGAAAAITAIVQYGSVALFSTQLGAFFMQIHRR